jgi:hypothetical protein
MEDGSSNSYSTGAARVTRTGVALVQEGELIFPAAGSQAEGEYVADDRYTVHYHFPVEIEIRGPESQPRRDDAIQRSHLIFAMSLDGQ